jgi:hypothetical protein
MAVSSVKHCKHAQYVKTSPSLWITISVCAKIALFKVVSTAPLSMSAVNVTSAPATSWITSMTSSDVAPVTRTVAAMAMSNQKIPQLDSALPYAGTDCSGWANNATMEIRSQETAALQSAKSNPVSHVSKAQATLKEVRAPLSVPPILL